MSQKIFDNDLVANHKIKVTVTLNKPVYVGLCIVDLGKVLICGVNYDYFKSKYGNNSKILFTDADNLMYEIKTEDVHEDFSKDRYIFGFINYSTKSKYYDNSNKLVVD